MLEASGIPALIVKAMSDKGYENLTPVQEEVFKDDYSGLDLLVSAQTGSGKTIAFGLAIVENILSDNSFFKTPKSPEALIIVPTRELALQVKNELSWLLASSEAKITSCVGGMDIRTEKRNLEPLGKIVSWASCGVDPARMGSGPIPSSNKALKLANWSINDLDLVESNEAFAADTSRATVISACPALKIIFSKWTNYFQSQILICRNSIFNLKP